MNNFFIHLGHAMSRDLSFNGWLATCNDMKCSCQHAVRKQVNASKTTNNCGIEPENGRE